MQKNISNSPFLEAPPFPTFLGLFFFLALGLEGFNEVVSEKTTGALLILCNRCHMVDFKQGKEDYTQTYRMYMCVSLYVHVCMYVCMCMYVSVYLFLDHTRILEVKRSRVLKVKVPFSGSKSILCHRRC